MLRIYPQPFFYTVKDGAQVAGLDPRIFDVVARLTGLWFAFFPKDADGMTITSGCEGTVGDGVHSPNSLHYKNLAIDLRVKDVDTERACTQVVPAMRMALGEDYDIIWEHDHIHVEYDPKV